MVKLIITDASTRGGKMARLLARLPWGRLGIGVVSQRRGFYFHTPDSLWRLFRLTPGRFWSTSPWFEICFGWLSLGFIRNKDWHVIHPFSEAGSTP
jgi:hypothetical protein